MTPQFDAFVKDFRDKKILIFGLGLLGRGVGDARLFSEIGAKVKITDQKSAEELTSSLNQLADLDIPMRLGQHHQADIDWADVIIRNAAVPWHHPLLAYARRQHKIIHMDSQLFCQYSNAYIVGVTGTRGKTTTTTLIHHILKQSLSQEIILAGNIQNTATLPFLKTSTEDTIAVLELSSWQLQAFHLHQLSPPSAVITNLYPDHLNYYTSLKEYYHDKKAIMQYQRSQDLLVIDPAQHPLLAQWADQSRAKVVAIPNHIDLELQLPGDHNRHNAALAYALTLELGIPEAKIRRQIATFTGVAYRQQLIAEINGVRYINDSTSTTPIATIVAIKAQDRPTILILGGKEKQLPTDELIKMLNSNAVKAIIFLNGSGTLQIVPHVNPDKVHLQTDSLTEAVRQASHLASPGDVVLFSPGFTSFGLFNNEFHRAQAFDQAVNAL